MTSGLFALRCSRQSLYCVETAIRQDLPIELTLFIKIYSESLHYSSRFTRRAYAIYQDLPKSLRYLSTFTRRAYA